MTIGEALINLLRSNFIHTILVRDEEHIKNTIIKGVKGNNMFIFPLMNKFELERVSDTQDKFTITYDDYKVEGIITWGTNKWLVNCYAIMDIQPFPLK